MHVLCQRSCISCTESSGRCLPCGMEGQISMMCLSDQITSVIISSAMIHHAHCMLLIYLTWKRCEGAGLGARCMRALRIYWMPSQPSSCPGASQCCGLAGDQIPYIGEATRMSRLSPPQQTWRPCHSHWYLSGSPDRCGALVHNRLRQQRGTQMALTCKSCCYDMCELQLI